MARLSKAFGLAVATAGAIWAAAGLRRRHALVTRALPELRGPRLYPPLDLSGTALKVLRRLPTQRATYRPGLTREVRSAAASEPIKVSIYEPATRRTRPSGALLWIHGGGLVIGSVSQDDAWCQRIADEVGILVASVEYRLAPEHPFPAPLDDCYTALEWLHAEGEDLGIDPTRIAVGGGSAGGGLAAAVAQRAHDSALDVSFQLLQYPMLDDRTVLRAEAAGDQALVWSPPSNRLGWTSYLGHAPSKHETRAYAVPARREDLSGLPPAWIGVGDMDLLHDEAVAYAERLRGAGVACDLLVVKGMYHGADGLFEKAPSMTAFRQAMIDALRAHLG